MFDAQEAGRRIRELVAEADAALPMIGISGSGHTINVTINAAPPPPTNRDRDLRLTGIASKLGRVHRGEVKCSAYLRRQFGKRALAELTDAEVEQLWAWVMTLSPMRTW